MSRLLDSAAAAWGALPFSLRKRLLHLSNARFMVGVVGLIHDGEGHVLLLEHRFRPPYPWGLPGGFIERGETFEAALARELREEIDLEVKIEPGVFDVEQNLRGEYLSVALVAFARSEALKQPRSREILQGAFFAPGDLPKEAYPYHAALIDRFCRRQNAVADERDVPGDTWPHGQ